MNRQVSYSEKHIEDKLSKIGAKVVKATENSLVAKKLCDESNQLLMDAQNEIADLYESLGDVLAVPTKKRQTKKAPAKSLSSPPED